LYPQDAQYVPRNIPVKYLPKPLIGHVPVLRRACAGVAANWPDDTREMWDLSMAVEFAAKDGDGSMAKWWILPLKNET